MAGISSKDSGKEGKKKAARSSGNKVTKRIGKKKAPRRFYDKVKKRTGKKAVAAPVAAPVATPAAVTPFPLQLLPMELQIQVWRETICKPLIHFLDIAVAPDTMTWSPKLRPRACKKEKDDSGWRLQEFFSGLCLASSSAAEVWPESHRAVISLPEGIITVDGYTDLLCLGIAPGFRHHWYPLDPQRPLNLPRTQAIFRGFRNIGFTLRPQSEKESAHEGNPFLCLSERCSGRRFCLKDAMCPREIANFIDCCPDIEVFYLVIPLTELVAQSTTPPQPKKMRKWSRDRRCPLNLAHANTPFVTKC